MRVAEMEALRDGPPPAPDPSMTRFTTAAIRDAELFRALLEILMCLAPPQEVLSRPGTAEKAQRLGSDMRGRLPGPSHSELVGLLTG